MIEDNKNTKTITKILDELNNLYHCDELPDEPEHDEPLDGLILTVLSQNTNDKNRDKAYEKLKSLYPSWESVSKAAREDIEDAIRTAGLANTKSARIKEILEIIKEHMGGYTLKPLLGGAADDVRDFLEKLPGVGPKTAACVMVFDMCIPAFPVDTHIERIAKRLGWASAKSNAVLIQRHLEKIIPQDRFRGGHLNIITHGRKCCAAQKPKCAQCPLTELCPFYIFLLHAI